MYFLLWLTPHIFVHVRVFSPTCAFSPLPKLLAPCWGHGIFNLWHPLLIRRDESMLHLLHHVCTMPAHPSACYAALSLSTDRRHPASQATAEARKPQWCTQLALSDGSAPHQGHCSGWRLHRAH